MANPNYRDPNERIRLIEHIKSAENIERKRKSLKDYEIYNDNAEKFVKEKLVKQLSKDTVVQMPIVSNLNISKAVVNKEATIYLDAPVRSYTEITPDDDQVLKMAYSDFGFNSILNKSNKYYKLRNQTFLQVVPKYGKLKLRVLHGHNIDVVPDESDPETAFAYVVSTFDKNVYGNAVSDNVNQVIADADDYKISLERYQVTTNELTFVMDGRGILQGEMLLNPIGIMPFIDVAKDKDFEFFVRIGQALTDFTVDFNVSWTDLLYIARMQGYSVGVMSGPTSLVPKSIFIGPSRLLHLPSNPADPAQKLELDFKSPTPNIEGQLKTIENLLGIFLSTRGIDAKAVSSTNSGSSYSSALEKLLAMIDQFKATKEDFDLYTVVEKKLHKIVTSYLSLLSGTEFLDPKYWVSQGIINSELSIQFKEPTMVETISEKLANGQKKIELGIADRTSVLAELNGITEEAAEEIIEKIDERRIARLQLPPTIETEETEEGDEAGE
jgi:hypothetical protein